MKIANFHTITMQIWEPVTLGRFWWHVAVNHTLITFRNINKGIWFEEGVEIGKISSHQHMTQNFGRVGEPLDRQQFANKQPREHLSLTTTRGSDSFNVDVVLKIDSVIDE